MVFVKQFNFPSLKPCFRCLELYLSEFPLSGTCLQLQWIEGTKGQMNDVGTCFSPLVFAFRFNNACIIMSTQHVKAPYKDQ